MAASKKISSDWVCYLLVSSDSSQTYVGASNDAIKRLWKHNTGRGAKRTKGQHWSHVLIVSGFRDKIACLSFEAGWKRISKRRSNKMIGYLDPLSGIELKYTDHTVWNRLLDLLYFLHQFDYKGGKFKTNKKSRGLNKPHKLKISYKYTDNLDCINDMPWPHFVRIKS